MGQLKRRLGVIGLVSGVSGVPDFFNYKSSARLASVGNIDESSAPATIDGVAPVSGDRILLHEQTDPIENGIWAWNGASVAMSRTSDFDESADVAGGAEVNILQGTTYADQKFTMATDFPDVGTDPINFIQFTGNPTVQVIGKSASFTLDASYNGLAVELDATGGAIVITCPSLFEGMNVTFFRTDTGTNDISFLASATTIKSSGGALFLTDAQYGGASIIYADTTNLYLKGEVSTS